MKHPHIIKTTASMLLGILYVANSFAQFDISYDSRTLNYVTPVKDQGTCGACWAFASCAAMESSWLRQGFGIYDLSEDNLIDCHNFDPNPCDWGNYYMTNGILSLHKGIFTEAQDGYTPLSQDCPFSYTFPPTPVAYIEEIRFIPGTINDIKQALLDYAAVATTMYMNWNDPSQWDEVNYKYYDPEITAVDETYGHCVAIVGWDDTYTFTGAPGNGGWIIKDSYSTSWADNGYFYCSYYDASILGTNVVFPTKQAIPDPKNNAHVYSHDEFGWVDNYGFSTNTAYALTKYAIAPSGGKMIGQQIKRIGTYAVTDNTAIDIELYRTKTGDALSGLIASVNIICPVKGFYTAPLAVGTDTIGTEIYIKVTYTCDVSSNQPIPIEKMETGSSSAFVASTGSCWISNTGSTWTQIGQGTAYSFDLCIKMYTEDAPYAHMDITSQSTSLPVSGTACHMDNLMVNNNSAIVDSLKWYVNDIYNNDAPSFMYSCTTTGDIDIKLIEWYGNNSDTAVQSFYVAPLPAVPTITQIGNTLQSSTAYSYQWLYDDLSPISGETNQTYVPAAEGLYRVQTGNSYNCTSISDPYNFVFTSIKDDINSDDAGVISYNQATGILQLEYQSGEDLDLRLYDISGRLLHIRKLNKSNTIQTIRIDLNPYRNGILILHLVGGNDQQVYRILKN